MPNPIAVPIGFYIDKIDVIIGVFSGKNHNAEIFVHTTDIKFILNPIQI